MIGNKFKSKDRLLNTFMDIINATPIKLLFEANILEDTIRIFLQIYTPCSLVRKLLPYMITSSLTKMSVHAHINIATYLLLKVSLNSIKL